MALQLILLINMVYNMSNKKTFTPKKSAFSLIELSIVLIIIGLLIAGITGGASLVNSATLRAVMTEARGYAVAVNSFYGQYNALPGDYNSATLPTTNVYSGGAWTGGNANNTIEFSLGEGTGALNHLVGAKVFDPTSYFPTAGTVGQMAFVPSSLGIAQVPGTNLPISKAKGAGWAFDNVPTGVMYSGSTTQNVVALTSTTGTTASTPLTAATTNNATAALVPSDMLSIDTKLDDGKPTAGRVTATAVAGCFSGTITATTATYQTGTTTKACVLAYQIDPNI